MSRHGILEGGGGQVFGGQTVFRQKHRQPGQAGQPSSERDVGLRASGQIGTAVEIQDDMGIGPVPHGHPVQSTRQVHQKERAAQGLGDTGKALARGGGIKRAGQ